MKERTFLVTNLWNKVTKLTISKSLKVDSILIFAHVILCLESDPFLYLVNFSLAQSIIFQQFSLFPGFNVFSCFYNIFALELSVYVYVFFTTL